MEVYGLTSRLSVEMELELYLQDVGVVLALTYPTTKPVGNLLICQCNLSISQCSLLTIVQGVCRSKSCGESTDSFPF
jgi:hypothetical protein